MAQLSHKTCSICGETKPLEEFQRDARAKDGLRPDCKTCSRARSARYREATPNKRAERNEYGKRWRAENQERNRETRRRYREANRDRNNARNQAWRQANSEHLQETESRKRDAIRAAVFAHYGQSCTCCGATEDLTIDHVNGGGTQHRQEVLGRGKVAGWVFYSWLIQNGFPEGFQVLCFPCNRSKHNRKACGLNHG